MDPSKEFCPNPDCPAKGQVGKGNIVVHSKKEKRYKCNECKKTFSETKGTIFYRVRKDHQFVTIVTALLSSGWMPASSCSICLWLGRKNSNETAGAFG